MQKVGADEIFVSYTVNVKWTQHKLIFALIQFTRQIPKIIHMQNTVKLHVLFGFCMCTFAPGLVNDGLSINERSLCVSALHYPHLGLAQRPQPRHSLGLPLPGLHAEFSDVEGAAAPPVRPADEGVLLPAQLHNHQVADVRVSGDEKRLSGISI